MLGSSVEMRRCSTNTSTEAAGDIMVMHCRPPGQRAARRRSSVDSVFGEFFVFCHAAKATCANKSNAQICIHYVGDEIRCE